VPHHQRHQSPCFGGTFWSKAMLIISSFIVDFCFGTSRLTIFCSEINQEDEKK
jgi:hypothetical protein